MAPEAGEERVLIIRQLAAIISVTVHWREADLYDKKYNG